MNLRKYGLKKQVIKNIKDVFSVFPEVDEAILYGSRAKGNFKPGSDIDLTLNGNNLNLTVLNKISLRLDDLLLAYTFDLSIYNHIKDKDLIDHINRKGIPFYKKGDAH